MKIELPWPDRRLSPNARVHWRARLRPKEAAREIGFYYAIQSHDADYEPMTGDLRVAYHLHPPSKRRYDQDNVIAAMKPMIDGVCHGLAIDDIQFKETVITWGEPVKGGQVVMEIEEL